MAKVKKEKAPVSVTFVKAEGGREGLYINGVLILESQKAITAQDLAAKLGWEVGVTESGDSGALPFHLDHVALKEYAV